MRVAIRIQTIAWAVGLVLLAAFLMRVMYLGRGVGYLLWSAAVVVGLVLGRHLHKRGRLSAAQRGLSSVARRLDWVSISHIVWAAILARLTWALYMRPVPISDYKSFFLRSQKLQDGDWSVLGVSKSPLTILWYASFAHAPFDRILWIYFANAVVGGLQCYLVYRLALSVHASTGAARLAAAVLAVFPSLVVYSGLPSSEVPFVTLMLLLLFVYVRMCRDGMARTLRSTVTWGAAFGTLAALLHLTRNIGVGYGAILLVLLWIYARTTRRLRAIFSGSALIAAVIVLSPQIAYNHRTLGSWSINSSKWASLNMLSGTNMVAGGRHNFQDSHYFKIRDDPDHWHEAVEGARKMAWERVSRSPGRFLKFALRTKFLTMWCRDDYGLELTVPVSSPAVDPDPPQVSPARRRAQSAIGYRPGDWKKFKDTWRERTQSYYFAFLALSLVAVVPLVRRGRVYRAYLVAVSAMVGATVLLHLVIEVQARYHYFLPFVLAVLACGLFAPAPVENPAPPEPTPAGDTAVPE